MGAEHLIHCGRIYSGTISYFTYLLCFSKQDNHLLIC